MAGSPFDMFRSAPQQQPAQQQPQNNQQQQNQNQNLNDPSQQQNNQQQQQQQNPPENKSPLAEWAGLWDTAPLKEGEVAQPDWNDYNSFVPEVKIDPKKLMDTAKRIDFSKVMNPDRVKAALAGDQGAFNEVINTVVQAAFANMAMSTTKIVENMTRQFAEKMVNQGLPHHMKKHSVNSAIDAEMPLLSDPAVAPMFEMFKSQMQAKYPRASAAEHAKMAKKMITDFSKAVTADPTQDPNKRGNSGAGINKTGVGEEDWGDFFAPATNN